MIELSDGRVFGELPELARHWFEESGYGEVQPLRKTPGQMAFSATTWSDPDLFRQSSDGRTVRAFVICDDALQMFEIRIDDTGEGEGSLIMLSDEGEKQDVSLN